MITYVDTSVLVKLLVAEPGSDDARQVWAGADHVAAVALVSVEARAALAAARRAGRLTVEHHRESIASLRALTDQLDLIRITDDLIDHAGVLAEADALRGHDAVHLAGALLVGATVMASADATLGAAAAGHGLHVTDPTSG